MWFGGNLIFKSSFWKIYTKKKSVSACPVSKISRKTKALLFPAPGTSFHHQCVVKLERRPVSPSSNGREIAKRGKCKRISVLINSAMNICNANLRQHWHGLCVHAYSPWKFDLIWTFKSNITSLQYIFSEPRPTRNSETQIYLIPHLDNIRKWWKKLLPFSVYSISFEIRKAGQV